jgi:hypothetical protein
VPLNASSPARVLKTSTSQLPERIEYSTMSAGVSQNGAAGSFVSFSSLPPEIWRLVGEEVRDCRSVAHSGMKADNIYNQIHGPKTLEALTRVCRAFRDIFTPFLNARRVVQLNRCTVAGLDQKPLPTGIRYTRDLEILLLEFDRKQPQYEVGMNDAFALFIVRMLEAMPQLQSFRSVSRMNMSDSATELRIADGSTPPMTTNMAHA